jgi:hypothetical protein
VNGYLSSSYAESLSEWGQPIQLPRSGAWLLEKVIPGSDRKDACALYPLLCCRDWSALKRDLEELADRWVSVVAVCDPLGTADHEELRDAFNGPVRAFKKHYLIDLRRDPSSFVNQSHRRRQRRALRNMTIEEVEHPEEVLDDWVRLYSVLVGRHGIQGLRRFSRKSFARQLKVPGVSVWRACLDGETVSMALWYLHRRQGYYHLGASSESGYQKGASHAIFGAAIAAFKSRDVRALNLGGGHGLSRRSGDGLERFKKGWSSGSKTAYLCGSVFDPQAYALLSAGTATTGSRGFFPAYRSAEAWTNQKKKELCENEYPFE